MTRASRTPRGRHDVRRAGETKAKPDADNNLGRGAQYDREERLQQIQRNAARSIEQDPHHGHREAQDLDQEDAELHREGVAGAKPGVRPSKEEAKRSK